MSTLSPYGGMLHGQPAETAPHLLVSGPTGIGKTRRILGPSVAMWDGPMVAVSSKADLLKLTVKERSRRGMIYLLDLSGNVTPPEGVHLVRADPVNDLKDDDEAIDLAALLLRTGTLGAGTSGQSDASFWQTQAVGPLAAVLLAAARLGLGITWTISALGTRLGEDGADAVENPSWTAAIEVLGDDSPHAESLLALSLLDDRIRDSVVATMSAALAPWSRMAVRGNPEHRAWSPARLVPTEKKGQPTLYVVAPATGVAAGAAVAALHGIIQHWRAATERDDPLPMLGMVIDELANTAPLPDLPTYVTEARGLGLAMTVAVQATEQLRLRWGEDGRDVLRQVFPATLVMLGAPEKEMLESAAWWGGRSERWGIATDESGSVTGRSSTRDASMEAADLLPRDLDQARLLVGGQPGQLVTIPDYSNFTR